MNQCNIIVLGPIGVGKSVTTIQFVQGVFLDDYDPTIEDSYRKQANIDDETVLLDILDSAGQEEFARMRDAYIWQGQGFILMYSTTDRLSFEEMPTYFETVYRVKDVDRFPICLVGNKVDLEEDRQVTTDEGKELAKKHECVFFESSAKTRVNVDELFYETVREIRKYINKHTTKRKQRGCIVM